MFGRRFERWRDLARPLELRASGNARLVGERGGRSLALEADGTAATLVVSLTEPLPPGTHLSSERRTPRVKLARLGDIQTGEQAVDDAVVVQSSNPAAVIRLLREDGVRELAAGFFGRYPSAVATGQALTLTLEAPDEALARAALTDACRLAAALDATLAAHREAAAQARAAAMAVMPPERPKPPPPPPPPDPLQRIRAEYSRLQALLFATGFLPALSGFALLTASQKKLIGAAWAVRGMLLFFGGVLGVVAGRLYYRCPACKEPLMARRGVVIGLERCPSCSVRLV